MKTFNELLGLDRWKQRWDSIPRVPVVAAWIGVAIPVLAGTFAATAIAFVAVTVVTNVVLRALQPKSGADGRSRGIQTNIREATAAHRIIYGQARVGGVITYLRTSGTTNKYLHMVITLAGHEVEEVGDIYINDSVATLDGSGFVTSGSWDSKIRVRKYTGSASQTADSELSTFTSSNFRGQEVAYLYVRMEYDSDVFKDGIPVFNAVVKGKKVYDTRTTTSYWTDNAALCTLDYLTSEYGVDSVIADVDTTYMDTAADVCDEAVALSTTVSAGAFVVDSLYEIKTVGTTDFTLIGASANTVGVSFTATGVGSGTGDAYDAEVRYTCNGVFTTDRQPIDILSDLMTASNGQLWWGQGSWKFKAGNYTTPVETFTLSDVRSEINVSPRVSRKDNFNKVRGTFVEAANDWLPTDYPETTATGFVTEDNSVENIADLALPFTTSSSMCQRISKQVLFRAREQITVQATFGLSALDVEVGDNVYLDLDRYGWGGGSAKAFEVVSWNLSTSDKLEITVDLTLKETSSAAFDWSAEESDITSNNTTLSADDVSDWIGTAGISRITDPSQVDDDVIVADAIDVTQLSDIVALVGTLRTATSGERVEIKDDLIEVYDSSNTVRVKIGDLT